MTLLERIPLPGPPGEALLQGATASQDILSKILAGKQNAQKLQQDQLNQQNMQQYRQDQLALAQQNSQRQAEMQPYNIGLAQSRIQANQGLANQRNAPENLELLRQKVESEKQRSKSLGALAEQRMNNPYGRAGVGQREEEYFKQLVGKDNPNLRPDQLYEASNILRQGGNTLSDGTQLNPLSPASQQSFNRLVKGGTYAGIVTPTIQAVQREAEMEAMLPMINADFAPYATTFAGFSDQQIIDSFKNDDESQKRLGNFIASQAGQYEAAQLRNYIAGGRSGIQATRELLEHSGQRIKPLWIRASAKARLQASKRLDEYLKTGLDARRSVDVGIASSMKKNQSNEKKLDEGKIEKTKTENGKEYVFFNGSWHFKKG